ncbi:MAG TPA: glycosyltransferase family 2 protein [Pyrinomonadaceae bacterium]|nr:glycosyltransferase family 2 protein [Pyrinomonadaceae bacterium]
MRISIALCTYNGEIFLSEQLASYLNQSRLPDELVICDDRSSDKTVEILQDFAKTAPFEVKLFVNEQNLGVTKNFEKAISLCTGEIIFLSDQDDVWMPEKLQIIENEFEKSPEISLIFTDAELVDEKLQPLGHNLWEFALWEYSFSQSNAKQEFNPNVGFETLIFGRTVAGCNMAFRAKIVKVLIPFPQMKDFLIHDGWILLASSLFFKIKPFNQALVKYRQHANQQIGVPIEKPSSNYESRKKAFEIYIKDCQAALNRIELLKEICKTIVKKHPNSIAPNINPMEILDASYNKFNDAITHYSMRGDLPKNHLKRISRILPELFKGNYHRYSNGLRSVLKDFIEVIR